MHRPGAGAPDRRPRSPQIGRRHDDRTSDQRVHSPAARPVTVGGQVRSAALVTLGSGWSRAAGPSSPVLGRRRRCVGFGMVSVFFGTGAVVVNAVASVSPAASLLVALLTYTLQVVLVAWSSRPDRSGALGDPSTGPGPARPVIVATLVWLLVHIVSATRAR